MASAKILWLAWHDRVTEKVRVGEIRGGKSLELEQQVSEVPSRGRAWYLTVETVSTSGG